MLRHRAITTPLMETIPPRDRSIQPIIKHMDMAMLRIMRIHAWVKRVVILPGVKKFGTRIDAIKIDRTSTYVEFGRFEILKLSFAFPFIIPLLA